MQTIAVQVGEGLLRQEAFLLPTVHDMFCQCVSDLPSAADLGLGDNVRNFDNRSVGPEQLDCNFEAPS